MNQHTSLVELTVRSVVRASAGAALILMAGIGQASAPGSQEGVTTSAPAREPVGRPYEVRMNVPVPMRDGAALNATIVTPPGQTAGLPVVLIFTPYGADRYYPVAAYFAQHGYVGAIVEVRGRGDSQGKFVPYAHDGDDAFDAIEWLAKQPFADGRVVMRGASYTGLVQWLAAARRPPALKTIVPAAPSYYGLDNPAINGVALPYHARWSALVTGNQRNTNLNEDLRYWNGLFAELARGEFGWRELYAKAGYREPVSPDQLFDHPVLDDYWKAIQPSREQLAAIRIPILAITGNYDGAQRGSLEHFRRYLAANPQATERSYLLIGPWDHAGVTNPARRIGGVDLGEAAVTDMLALHLAWFDHVLKGAPVPAQLAGRLTYYTVGEDHWHGGSFDESAPLRRFFLSSPHGGSATLADAGALAPRSGRRDVDRFRYDPTAEPLGWGGEEEAGSDFLTKDALLPVMNGNGLVYDTAPFGQTMDLIGHTKVSLRAVIDVPDTDLATALYAVMPDGGLVRLGTDVLRARYRNGIEAPSLIPAGQAQSYRFDLGWTARRLPAGTRLRLLITSPGISYFFQRNRNTGGDVSRESVKDSRVATVALRLGAAGSTVDLPLRAVP